MDVHVKRSPEEIEKDAGGNKARKGGDPTKK